MNPNDPTQNKDTVNAVWRLLLRVALIAAACFAVYHLRTIIITLLVGAIIAYVFEPMVDWLMRRPAFVRLHALPLRLRNGSARSLLPSRHTMRLAATLYVFCAALIALGVGLNLIIKPFQVEIQSFMRHKPEYIRQYNETVPLAWRNRIEDKLNDDDFKQQMQDAALPYAAKGVSALGNVVEILLLPVLAFYFIVDGEFLKKEFVALVPRRYFRDAARLIGEFNAIMNAFVLGQFVLCVLAGVLVGGGLALLHVKFAFVLGILAGLTRAIPIVGPLVGGVPIIALTYFDGGLNKALAVLGFFTLMHFAESKFIMPILLGDRLELHPVVIIVTLLIGGEFGGLLLGGSVGALLGMFFAAPIAALLRVIIRRYRLNLTTRPPRKALAPTVAVSKTSTLPIPLPEPKN